MLRIGTVVMRVADLQRAIDFWCQALRYEPEDIAPEGDFAILGPVDGDSARLALDVSASPAPEQPSVHLDLYADDADEQARQVDRLVSIGATAVDWKWYPAAPDFIVLADPEGNRFCVINASHEAP